MNTIPLHNYWTPLASQVEVLDPDHLLSIHSNAPRCFTFALSPSHIDRDSTEYQRGWHGHPPNKRTLHPTNPLIHINKMKKGVLNSTIPSAVSDTGTTLSAFLKKDPSRATGKLSTTVFHLPNSAIAPVTTRNKLLHNVREPAHSVNTCRKLPRYVPYKCTYVPYDGTFGASDQGQTLEV